MDLAEARPLPKTAGDTLTRPDLTPTTDGDHERFSHIVRAKDGKGASVLVTEAMVNGTPVEALCGKVWVPSRDPKRYPVCPTCREIAEGMS
ncbi:MAG: DUF3039 domain-containing protein [Actinomycetota bacterium]|jgi:hypothetical protein|nr:DUF3039 domain-containing protein [Actinomycetota bacterium]